MGKNDALYVIGGIAVLGILWYTGAFCKFAPTARTPLCRSVMTPTYPNPTGGMPYRNIGAAKQYQHQLYHLTGK